MAEVSVETGGFCCISTRRAAISLVRSRSADTSSGLSEEGAELVRFRRFSFFSRSSSGGFDIVSWGDCRRTATRTSRTATIPFALASSRSFDREAFDALKFVREPRDRVRPRSGITALSPRQIISTSPFTCSSSSPAPWRARFPGSPSSPSSGNRLPELSGKLGSRSCAWRLRDVSRRPGSSKGPCERPFRLS